MFWLKAIGLLGAPQSDDPRKRATSRYRSRPSRNWLKIKNVVESEFVLLGLERDNDGRPFAHLAREGSRGLEYAGMAFMTFGQKVYTELSRRARSWVFLSARRSAFSGQRRRGCDR